MFEPAQTNAEGCSAPSRRKDVLPGDIDANLGARRPVDSLRGRLSRLRRPLFKQSIFPRHIKGCHPEEGTPSGASDGRLLRRKGQSVSPRNRITGGTDRGTNGQTLGC